MAVLRIAVPISLFCLALSAAPPARASEAIRDDQARLTQITDEDGRTVRFEYDAQGRLARAIYGDGKVVHYLYDEDGQASGTRVSYQPQE